MKKSIFYFIFLIAALAKAQKPPNIVPKMELDAAYFGELGFNPGVKIALNRYFRTKQKHLQTLRQ